MNFPIFLLIFALLDVSFGHQNKFETTINELNRRLEELHVKKETSSYRPPFKWHKLGGLYESYIHMYTHGGPLMTKARRDAKVYDNNCFVTSIKKIVLYS